MRTTPVHTLVHARFEIGHGDPVLYDGNIDTYADNWREAVQIAVALARRTGRPVYVRDQMARRGCAEVTYFNELGWDVRTAIK